LTLKKFGIVTIMMFVCIAVFYNLAVYRAATSLITKLDGIATVSPITTFSQVIQRPVIIRGLD
jgi:hypothetical protein